jgi:hypothetical protein
MAQQSRLEKEAFIKRPELEMMNTYQDDINEYSSEHKNAISDGDVKGKGVGGSAHPYLLPNPDEPKTSYKPTLRTDDGGGALDIAQRETLENINIYSRENQYGPNFVDTSKNVADGQYVVIK